jgi:hypothetical protein
MRRWSTFTPPRHAANAARCGLFLLRRSYLGKTTFHLVALGDNGKVLLKKKFSQRQLIRPVLMGKLPRSWKTGLLET